MNPEARCRVARLCLEGSKSRNRLSERLAWPVPFLSSFTPGGHHVQRPRTPPRASSLVRQRTFADDAGATLTTGRSVSSRAWHLGAQCGEIVEPAQEPDSHVRDERVQRFRHIERSEEHTSELQSR